MKQQSAKRSSEVKLKDIRVEFLVRDNSITEVQLTDADGNACFISATTSYSATLCVYIPSPPKMVKKTQLTGSILGVPIAETFASSFEAEQRKNAIVDGVRGDHNDAPLEISEVEVPDDNEVPF